MTAALTTRVGSTGMAQGKDNVPVSKIGLVSRELGMGRPPPGNDDDADAMVAQLCCAEDNRLDVVESAEWQWELPLTDTTIGNLFNGTINPWATANGNPPTGISAAYNTLSTPGMPNGNMIVWGLMVRICVESEGRTIDINYYIPPASSTVMPASPDVFTAQDVTSGALGIPSGGSTPIPGSLLYGLPTWKAAYAMTLGYGLNFSKNHQESLIRQPLKMCAIVEPFSKAEAAGLAFSTNADRINGYNNYTQTLGVAGLGYLLPITHKRLGTYAAYAAGAQGPDLTVTREEDTAPTAFGGIGEPQNIITNPSPLIFSTPLFWPRGSPLNIELEVINQHYANQMQRWMSLTGGTGGNAGSDLNLPVSATGPAGFTPATSTTALEQSLDTMPVAVNGSVNTNRTLAKAGTMNLIVALLGKRVPESWHGCVARMIAAGAMQTPEGYGDLGWRLNQMRGGQ